MARQLDSATRDALVERVRFYRDLGLTEFYRRPVDPALMAAEAAEEEQAAVAVQEAPAALNNEVQPVYAPAARSMEDQTIPPRKTIPAPPEVAAAVAAADRAAALQVIREEIGDCTRCALHKGRNKIVFADGDPNARLMFVGEGPGADEDAQGLPSDRKSVV